MNWKENMKRKHIILSILCGISLLFFAVMTLIEAGVKNSLPDQQVSERWTDGTAPYAQVSVFSEALSAQSIDGIFTARVNIDKKLVENSLIPENENSRLWTDAFSSPYGKISLSTEHGSAEANLTVTGGDFFLFHPQEVLSGYYYSDDDLMQDRIMIDDVLAWQLYGSSDIEGMPVTIDGKYFYIAGVFSQSKNTDTKKVYGTKPRVFMSYRGYELLGKEAYFSCYEACLPNPVTGLGAGIVSEALSAENLGYEVVENSARYTFEKRFGIIRDFGMRSVVDSAIVYPYWENAARITEDKSALLLVLQLMGLIIPLGMVIYLSVLLYRKRKNIFSATINAAKRILNKLFSAVRKKSARNANPIKD